jgi:hypothetical protein
MEQGTQVFYPYQQSVRRERTFVYAFVLPNLRFVELSSIHFTIDQHVSHQIQIRGRFSKPLGLGLSLEPPYQLATTAGTRAGCPYESETLALPDDIRVFA